MKKKIYIMVDMEGISGTVKTADVDNNAAEYQRFRRQILFNLFIDNRRFLLIQHIHFGLHDIERHHFMVLSNQNAIR